MSVRTHTLQLPRYGCVTRAVSNVTEAGNFEPCEPIQRGASVGRIEGFNAASDLVHRVQC